MKLSEENVRSLVKEILLKEELTKTDRVSIEKLVNRKLKSLMGDDFSKMFDKEVSKRNSKLEKKVDDAVKVNVKKLKDDKDFEDIVIKIAKRVSQSIYTMHYNRKNLIKSMPVDKS